MKDPRAHYRSPDERAANATRRVAHGLITKWWGLGFDTQQIAQRLGWREAAVYNYLIDRRRA